MFHIKPGRPIILMGHLGEGPPPGHTSLTFLMLFNFLAFFLEMLQIVGEFIGD